MLNYKRSFQSWEEDVVYQPILPASGQVNLCNSYFMLQSSPEDHAQASSFLKPPSAYSLSCLILLPSLCRGLSRSAASIDHLRKNTNLRLCLQDTNLSQALPHGQMVWVVMNDCRVLQWSHGWGMLQWSHGIAPSDVMVLGHLNT